MVLRYVAGGLVFTVALLAISFFYAGTKAAFLRLLSLVPPIVSGLVGVIYAAIFLTRVWLAQRRWRDKESSN